MLIRRREMGNPARARGLLMPHLMKGAHSVTTSAGGAAASHPSVSAAQMTHIAMLRRALLVPHEFWRDARCAASMAPPRRFDHAYAQFMHSENKRTINPASEVPAWTYIAVLISCSLIPAGMRNEGAGETGSI